MYIWKVYVNVVNIMDGKILLLILLVKVIVEIYGKYFGQNGFVIFEML